MHYKEYSYIWTPNPKYVQEVNEILENNINKNSKWLEEKSNIYNQSHKNLLEKVKNFIC